MSGGMVAPGRISDARSTAELERAIHAPGAAYYHCDTCGEEYPAYAPYLETCSRCGTHRVSYTRERA